MTTNEIFNGETGDREAALLSYDIPKGTKMPNPSRLLSGLGMFRVNLSVWVGTLPAIARTPLDKWGERGAKCLVMEFKPSEWSKLRMLAEQELEKELVKLRDFMQQQMAKAEGMFVDAEAAASAKGVKKARSRMVGLVRKANRRTNAAKAAMLAFDLFNTRQDLSTAFDETCAAYAACVLTAKEKEKDGAASMQLALLSGGTK